MSATERNIAGSLPNCSVFPAARTRMIQPQNASRFFPFYFQQRSPDPNENYTALFPLYGHLKNRLFRDEIFFVLFPIYGETRKRDVVTDNYLYPFFHLRHGDGLQGWQFWPLVGSEHKDVTTKTNGFGETEIIGGHDKFFALWPIYFQPEQRHRHRRPGKIPGDAAALQRAPLAQARFDLRALAVFHLD